MLFHSFSFLHQYEIYFFLHQCSSSDTVQTHLCVCYCPLSDLSPFACKTKPFSLFLSPAALSARYGSPKRQLQFYRYLFVCWLISHGHLILHLFSSVLESALRRLGFILSLAGPYTIVILLKINIVHVITVCL